MARKEGQGAQLTRRALLAGAAAAGGAAVAAESAVGRPRHHRHSPGPDAGGAIPPNDGPHQAGISTPRQSHLVLAAFDAHTPDAGSLVHALRMWTRAVRELTAGRPVGGDDSAETHGLPASRLTITIGFGATLFDGRYGLAARRPRALAPLPPLPGDELDPARSGGDIIVQACAEDHLVATHAVRQLTNLGASAFQPRWIATGFVASNPGRVSDRLRNPLGFVDGTANARPGSVDFRGTVWRGDRSDPTWLAQGTFLSFRRIRIDLGAWDRLSRGDQSIVIGREKISGSPLSGGGPDAAINLDARRRDGSPLIPDGSHVRVTAPQSNGGATMFRRSYAYEEAVDDAGLLFLAWSANPVTHVVPVLRSVATSDRLNQFTTHTASGVWAVPPAPAAGGWLGQALFAG